MDATVFDSPALPLLVELEQAGFQLRVAPEGRLQIEPGSKLTADQRRLLVEHKAAVTLLLRCCDAGVVERRDAFRRQLEVAAPPTIPAFLFRPVPYVPGRCFSCGDETGHNTYS